MNQRHYVSQKKAIKPRGGLIILAVMTTLFIVVFTMSHRHKPVYNNEILPLPELSSNEEVVSNEPAQKNGWVTLKTQSGDTLASLFKRAGLSRQTLPTVLANNKYAKNLAQIKTNQMIQLLIKNQNLEKMIFPVNAMQFLVVTRNGKAYTTNIKSRKTNSQNDYVTATVRGSLYGTAKRLNIPYKLIHQMTDIFHSEIDFIRDVRAGDQFTLLYEADYIDDKLVNTGNILALSYTNRGVKHEAIRHVTADGQADYYTPAGQSLKKAFTRYPVKFSHISSTYSLSRYHPILHYSRPHKGVDLAASLGTPVHATGDGRIELIERSGAYGNMIKIKHSKQFSSLYAHLLKFQKGLSRGDRVKRDQVIGYVGQTGLADGPHCHYEFHVNQQARNPSTVKLPHSLPIDHREMAAFKAKVGALLAQLRLFEAAHLAGETKKGARNKA
jgi:murein DD-endopeptidase MepM/ murein hydrolase activator NlpD